MQPSSNKWAKVVVLVIVAGILLLGYKFFFDSKTPRVISTVGVGKKNVVADKSIISFAVLVTTADKNSAQTNGDAKMVDLMLKVNEFQPLSVNKTTPQIAPQYNQVGATRDTSSVRGYQYVTGAQVTLQGQDKVEPFLQMLNEQDVTVGQVRYLSADQEKVDGEVRELAIKDAKMKAEQMAKAAGARVGKVISIQEQATTGQGGSAVTSQTTSSNSTEVEAQSTITVAFELW